MAAARAQRPDPNVLAAAQLLRCAPTWDAVLTAIAATRQQLAVVPLDVLDERIRAAVRAERAEQLISDREAAEVWRDWPKHLVAECHKKKTGKTYPGVYGRMKYDEPAPTLTTQFYGFGNGRFGHPTQARGISLREGALLQGFPPDYSFVPDDEPVRFNALGRMIGNAVPVDLGRVIGESIIKHLRQHGDSSAGRVQPQGAA